MCLKGKYKFKVKTNSIKDILEEEGIQQESQLFISDTYYKKDENVVRVRSQNDEIIFNSKLSTSLFFMRDEFEVVTSYSIHEILQHLGYNIECNILKVRSIYDYNDVTICVDDVAELGCFVEFEVIGEENIDYLYEVMNYFDFNPQDAVKLSYYEMFMDE